MPVPVHLSRLRENTVRGRILSRLSWPKSLRAASAQPFGLQRLFNVRAWRDASLPSRESMAKRRALRRCTFRRSASGRGTGRRRFQPVVIVEIGVASWGRCRCSSVRHSRRVRAGRVYRPPDLPPVRGRVDATHHLPRWCALLRPSSAARTGVARTGVHMRVANCFAGRGKTAQGPCLDEAAAALRRRADGPAGY